LLDYTLPKEFSPFHSLIYFAKNLKWTGRKHHLTADSNFSNVQQAEALDKLGHQFTLCCKTTSASQDLWRNGLAKGLPKRKSRLASKNDHLISACYHEKQKVCLLSTAFGLKEGTISDYQKRHPLLNFYDDTKRCADQFNQLNKNYFFHTSIKNPTPTCCLVYFISQSQTHTFCILYGKKITCPI